MVWDCFAASGSGRLALINGTRNSALYQEILTENVLPTIDYLKLKQTWILQQDRDPNTLAKRSNSEWLKNKMTRPLQSLQMLLHYLKRADYVRNPSIVANLQQFCKDK